MDGRSVARLVTWLLNFLGWVDYLSYGALLTSKSLSNHSRYKIYQNKLKNILIVSKKLYYKEYFTYHVNDAKATWKGIKQLISSKRSKLSFPNWLTVDGNTLTDAKGIANAFNKYFASGGPMLANGIQPGNRTNSQCNSYYLSPVSTTEVENTAKFRKQAPPNNYKPPNR